MDLPPSRGSCFLYCKDTIFRANHNRAEGYSIRELVVSYIAKIRFFEQITTLICGGFFNRTLFLILQRYDFSSKSQQGAAFPTRSVSCFLYCKDTIFRANHNVRGVAVCQAVVVSYIAKIRFFEQITTIGVKVSICNTLFLILQRYDFSSKSQRIAYAALLI